MSALVRLVVSLLLVTLFCETASAQDEGWRVESRLWDEARAFTPLLASRLEGRMAASRSTVEPRFDAELGLPLDLVSIRNYAGAQTLVGGPKGEPTISFGVDPAFWLSRDLELAHTRVDYMVGVHISSSALPSPLGESRLRVARLGTLSDDVEDRLRAVEARDAWMFDLELATGHTPNYRNWVGRVVRMAIVRYGAGLRVVVPDETADSTMFSPSLGVDMRWAPWEESEVVLMGGLELRLYPGDATVVEQNLRIGAKYGKMFGTGVFLTLDVHNGDPLRAYPIEPSTFDVRFTFGGEF